MKTIIVATDFSAEAENAAEYAAQAGGHIGAHLILFHLYRVSVHAVNARLTPSALDEMAAVNKERLQERAKELAGTGRVRVTTHWASGDFHEEVSAAIRLHNADLLVMGMAGKSLEQDLLGNTTTSAIHRLKFPILAIPAGAKFRGISKILFACDMVRGVQKKILEEVKRVAVDFGGEVEVFHVNERAGQLAVQGAAAQVPDSFGEGLEGVSYYYRNVQSNAVIAAIQQEVKRIGADLLIMVPYRYGFWGSLVHRSKTRIMASGSEIPLLSLSL